ncbi:hypothetical protein GIS00_20130 [Nakamurella sp. YIM 132087]|uniref:DUF403 domain-containing protein n=1 Tax=Nakamurella alba TaxID=2665158 RepID=A0A7K1FQ39_9ACTN|nr:circularly permuted type 2 ATP-grasp protein [Nakamurella alba]MTD16251.1 hypothetical protein [Nakamurella alba]
MTGTVTLPPSLVESYRARSGLFPALPGLLPGLPGGWDELTGGSDELQPGWADVAAVLDGIGRHGLPALSASVDRLLEDEGVSYIPVGTRADGPPGIVRRWPVDPVPLIVDGDDWGRLESALVQRSTLLDAVLTDIYGRRSLIRRGLLPPELVFRHDHYLRAAHGIRIPGRHQLFFHAVDLCRGPGGDFLVLGDRAQAPSGSGYAMAGRRVISRVLPQLYRRSAPRSLGTYFHAMRGALQAVAPAGAEDARVVVLSPGTHSETAFDQAFLASLLGVPLVESADLTVRGGRVWMRAMGRYEPVDVVLRRVDADYSDPLDLRPDSALGVVGLVEACRRGTVTVVNTLGSGAVENPGLLPYLPALARDLLGEDLAMPSIPTWWCGDPDARGYVLSHLDDLIIKPTGVGMPLVPQRMSAAEKDELRLRILADPARWVGQEHAPFSEAPTVQGAELAARRVGMRTFLVAHQSGYVVMPGALGRVIKDDVLPHTILAGGAVAAKDVWVRSSGVDSRASAAYRRTEDSEDLVPPVEMAAAVSPRVLEDLFWLGRYAERTEDLTRLLSSARDVADTYRYRAGDAGAGAVQVLLDAVTRVSASGLGFPPGVDLMDQMRRLVLDSGVPGTVSHALSGLHETARSVRDQLSGDTWMVLAGVDRSVADLAAAGQDTGAQLQATHAAVISGMLALSGLASENMVRDPGWYLMDIGRRVERAQQLSALLQATLTVGHAAEVEATVIDAVLVVTESGVTYRRRYRGHLQVGTVLELLLLDQGNPRALAYQISTIGDALRRLPDASGTSRPERIVEDISSRLRRAGPGVMDDVDATGRRSELADFLAGIHESLRSLADAVAAQHFFRSRAMLPLGPLGPGGSGAAGSGAMS